MDQVHPLQGAVLRTDPPQAVGRILIADDDEPLRHFLKVVLTRHGYEVCEASDGVSALETAASDEPSLVLLDVGLPGVSGFEVCRRLKLDRATRGICVVLMSGADGDTTHRRSQEIGAEACLPKPFDRKQLLSCVGELVAPDKFDPARTHPNEV